MPSTAPSEIRSSASSGVRPLVSPECHLGLGTGSPELDVGEPDVPLADGSLARYFVDGRPTRRQNLGVAENTVPEWLAEGAHVVHAGAGPGQVASVRRERDGVWVCVAPPRSGPIVAYRLADALRDLRPRRLDEMSGEELEELDWESASFHPLTDDDPALAGEMANLLVDAFLAEGGLDPAHRDEALAQVMLEVGMTPRGVGILRTVCPLGTSNMETEWDGTADAAREIVSTAGATAGRTLVSERTDGVLTGWELNEGV